MTDVQRRVTLLVIATVVLVAGGQLILSLTPFELNRTATHEARLVGVLSEAVWLFAFVVLTLRNPTSQLWKLYVLWVAVAQVWTLGYLPIEPRGLIEVPAYLLGDLWAAVFIHLFLAYPSGRLADRFDRRLVGLATPRDRHQGRLLTVGPEDCWPVCGNPIRFFGSEPAWDVVRYTAFAVFPVVLALACVELGRPLAAGGMIGRRSLAPLLVAVPVWCVTIFAGYVADTFLDEAAQVATHGFNWLGLAQDLLIPVAILIGASVAGRPCERGAAGGRPGRRRAGRPAAGRAGPGPPRAVAGPRVPVGCRRRTLVDADGRPSRWTRAGSAGHPGRGQRRGAGGAHPRPRGPRPRTRACWRPSGRSLGWPWRTSGSRRRCGHSSRRSAPRGHGSWTRPTPSGGGWSATSTTAPSNGSSP